MEQETRPKLRAALRCSEGCKGDHDLFQVLYRCPTCRALLDVVHDEAAIAATPAAEWRALFDARVGTRRRPYGSGVWGKKEWVCPELPVERVVSLDEGSSSLFPAGRLGEALDVRALWVKLCGNSHTGSFKDLGMTVLISAVTEMRARGASIRAVACASTGDTSAALAAYAAAAGLPSVVLLPRGMISPAQLVQPMAHGARVLELDTDFDGCMALVKALAETKDSELYLANSMNPLRIEGQKTVAIEIVQQLDWSAPDWVIIPGGNLGNVSALGAGFDLLVAAGLLTRRPRICVAQAARANPLYRSFLTGFRDTSPIVAEETAASAIRIGNPVSIRRAIRTLQRFDGIVEQATEEELAEASARADRTGLYTCPHTGVALAALEKLRRSGTIGRDDRVVVVSTAHGLKFSDFKAAYHMGHEGGPSSLPAAARPADRNPPIAVPATIDAVLRALG